MMALYKEILAHALAYEGVQTNISGLEIDAAKIVELECYKALQRIKAVIEDDSLQTVEKAQRKLGFFLCL